MKPNATCLIVDDSDVIRKVMRAIIEGLDITVDEATSTEEAMAKCRGKLPDVIVLDWLIPGSNPMEFLATLQANQLGKRVKVLYALTNNDQAEISKARSAGVSEIVPKPFTRVQLEAKIIALLSTPRDIASELANQRPLVRAGYAMPIAGLRTAIEV
jgi:CheY-like chemotaxis protein